jgi:hypothetical protein
MILASGARGPEFDSRNTPFFLFIVSFLLFIFSETEIHRPAFFIRLWMSPWLKWSIGRPTKALGRSGTFFSFVEHEWVAGRQGSTSWVLCSRIVQTGGPSFLTHRESLLVRGKGHKSHNLQRLEESFDLGHHRLHMISVLFPRKPFPGDCLIRFQFSLSAYL